MRLVPLMSLLLCAATAHAGQTVYKCRVDGKLVYGDHPCPGGRGETLPPPPAGISADAAVGPTNADSRTLLELEKARTEQARQQAIAAREARAQARAGRVAVKQLQHCEKLRLQRKWLEEDLARAQTPARQDAARTKLRRQADTLAVECPG